MCRLFGLHAGAATMSATFWLLDAPDSLAAQSHRNPDGAGIGVFGAGGVPRVDKQPIAAWADAAFATEARTLTGTTFVAHVRHASTGGSHRRQHPSVRAGRPAVRAQRCRARPRPARRTARRAGRGGPRARSDRQRAGLRVDHGRHRRARRGRARRADGGDRLGRRAPAGVLGEPGPGHGDRPVGPALPGSQRAVAPSPPGGRHRGRAGPRRPYRPHPRPLRAAGRPPGSSSPASRWTTTRRGARCGAANWCTSAPDLTLDVSVPFADPPAHPLTLADLQPREAASQTAGGVRTAGPRVGQQVDRTREHGT